MAWTRHQIDTDIIREDVKIFIYNGTDKSQFDRSFIQFPPIITKDSKSVTYKAKKAQLTYEVTKVFDTGEPRSLGIDFQWVTGGEFTPDKIKQAINQWKSPLYVAPRNPLNRYPLVYIQKLYHVIEGGATFRIHNISVKYSEELIKIGDDCWPIHTVLSIDLELAHQVTFGDSTSLTSGRAMMDNRLRDSPMANWY